MGGALPSALTAAAHCHLAALAVLGATAPCRNLVVLPSEQGLDLGGNLALIHGRAPLLVLHRKSKRHFRSALDQSYPSTIHVKMCIYHLQLLPQCTDGSLLAGHQLLQVLVPQLFPSPTLSGTLPAALQLGLQVDLGRFPAAFPRFLHLPGHHLDTQAHCR